MPTQRAVLALAIAASCLLAACERAPSGSTAVLGGSDGKAGVTDLRGRTIPPPPAPAGVTPRIAAAGEDGALAVFVAEGRPMASRYAPASGWSSAQALEDIHGDASDAQLAANAAGAGMAVWRHTVGSIQSLRYSRYDPGAGWSIPDVMPGALPRPPGQAAPPHLQMDEAGNVIARWPSGFDANETQVSRYAVGQGWSRAISEAVAAAPTASPEPPAPSSVR